VSTATRPSGTIGLAVGVVALEFAAAVTRFVTSTLLPVISRDLTAHRHLAMLLAGSTLGMFIALPLAGHITRRLGARRTLTVGMVAYVGGLAVAATADRVSIFALGQLVGGFASGLLAVFGISSAIQHLDEAMRVRVVAASSAMWIAPALVGPAATLGLEHLVGWRWTLLAPVPVVLVGRLLVVRAARPDHSQHQDGDRPLGRTLLVPLGVTAIVLGTGRWPLQVAGAAVALVGVVTIMPRGTFTLRRGTPAALAALLLFAIGYFGADSQITLMLTGGYHTSLANAAIVLSAAPLAWGLTSLAVPRFRRRHMDHVPALGLALTAVGVGALAVMLVFSPSFGAALVMWTLAGVGVGLAYPGLYIRATTAGTDGFTATQLATAAITAEAFGGLLAGAVGGAISSLGGHRGLTASYLMFGGALVAAALAAARMTARTHDGPDQRRAA
jgi:MFS family permease